MYTGIDVLLAFQRSGVLFLTGSWYLSIRKNGRDVQGSCMIVYNLLSFSMARLTYARLSVSSIDSDIEDTW